MIATADAVRLFCPGAAAIPDNIRASARRGLPMALPGRYAGLDAMICGAGPSLATEEALEAAARAAADPRIVLIACKGALARLRAHGIGAQLSVAIDPGPEQAAKVRRDRATVYYLASSCHPALFDHLAGCPVVVFHSASGVAGEGALYRALFPPPADVMCGGLTVVNRAYTLARWLGFARVTLAGCDFGWRDGGFGDPSSKGWGVRLRDRGRTDGREWFTRPDLLISAVRLSQEVHMRRCEIIGDSLAASLARLPRREVAAMIEISGSVSRPSMEG